MRGSIVPTMRDLQEARRLREKAGSREEYIRWGEEEPKRGQVGPRRDDYFTDFSVSELPWKGLYLVQFRIGGAAPLVCVIVRPKANRVKPGGSPRTWVEEQAGDYPTPHEAFCEIVKRTDQRARRNAEVENIARRLASEFRKQVRDGHAPGGDDQSKL
jgi:hypothetical protein